MKFLFDLFPVILFFISFKWAEGHAQAAQAAVSQAVGPLVSGGAVSVTQAPVLLATVVAIAASFLQIAYLLARRKKIDAMLWISLAIIVVFGGATIYFHNEAFIKWKPTILYWCFGGGLLVSLLAFKRNLIRNAMEEQVQLPEPVWQRLALSWGAFFLAMGALNLFVAFSFPLSTWVNFKMFGGMGLMFAFIVGQSLFLAKYMKDPQ